MKKILIIEDNREVRENLAEILELDGYKTLEAENGKSGVNMALEHMPDLILCDVMMPEFDGYGVLKILNRNQSLQHIPFMFLTAKSEKQDFRKGMGLGADDYITKPFDDVELLQSIEMRLKKSEEMRNLVRDTRGRKFFVDSDSAIAELLSIAEDHGERKYRAKDKIYEVGQYPQWLFYLVSGQMKSCLYNEFGKELITHIYGPTEFFGFLAPLRQGQYHETVLAMEDSVLKMIPIQKFEEMLRGNLDLMATFLRITADHATYSEHQNLDYAYSSVRKKVANALISLREKSEDNSIHVLRDDLAGLAGTAKETVIRTISDFKKEGIVSLSDHSVILEDLDALKQMPQ